MMSVYLFSLFTDIIVMVIFEMLRTLEINLNCGPNKQILKAETRSEEITDPVPVGSLVTYESISEWWCSVDVVYGDNSTVSSYIFDNFSEYVGYKTLSSFIMPWSPMMDKYVYTFLLIITYD